MTVYPPLIAILIMTGSTKLASAFFVLRAAVMHLGPGAEKLRRAFFLAGMMLVADGTFMVSYAIGLPDMLVLIWASGMGAWSIALAGYLLVRKGTHGEALFSGAKNKSSA